MKLRRYCVTVVDTWPMREFWTLEGAKKFYREHQDCANVWKWEDGYWAWVCGANDQGVILSTPLAVTPAQSQSPSSTPGKREQGPA